MVNKVFLQNIYQSENIKRLRFSFAKSVLIGLAIPTIGMWVWFSSTDPVKEYKLITAASIAKGFIHEVQEYNDVVEYNDGRSARLVHFYQYSFSFNLYDGKVIKGRGEEHGFIPDHLTDVEETPYSVVIEYLADDPTYNRVQGMGRGNKTVYEWVRYRLLFGVITLITCSYIGISIIKLGLKKYKLGLQHSKCSSDYGHSSICDVDKKL